MNSEAAVNAKLDAPPQDPAAQARSDRYWTVPNALCVLRIIGIPVMLWAAATKQDRLFFWLLFASLLSDWLDGKLARWLKQQSTFGARLDSVADALFFITLIPCTWLLRAEFLFQEKWWILAVVGAYVANSAYCLAKFRGIPSYHTKLAKVSWMLTAFGVLTVFYNEWPWLFRLAMAAVTLTNVQEMIITRILPERRSDVPSIRHAWELSKSKTSVEISGKDSTPAAPAATRGE